jgi:hypothetical protein
MAKFRNHSKETEIHFQNSWDQPDTCFYIAEIRTIPLTKREVIMNIRPNRADTNQVANRF